MTDEDITIIKPLIAPKNGRWNPVVGQETVDFLENVDLPETSQISVRDAAVSILSKGVPPGECDQETGLVIGYVQSGKTISFEAVAAVARDNDFQIIIVVAGTSNLLLEQSTGRLSRDLQVNESGRTRRWTQFQNPSKDDDTVRAIRHVLEDWRDPATPAEYKKTVLITVLKHHKRLQDLTDLLRAVGIQDVVPILIIDDEADRASLNTEVAQGQESTIYSRLMELRQVLPSHTYLQYTATPQAPLLVSIVDSLSPNFVEVLDPGEAYVGGTHFFTQNSPYIRLIPPQDVPSGNFSLDEPPESLLRALHVFMVGVAAGIKETQNKGNRSMLIHPSHRTDHHQDFCHWVKSIIDDWKRILELSDNDPDRQELMEEIRAAYDDLAGTVGDSLPKFDELTQFLGLAFRNTEILEINSRGGSTPTVEWSKTYGWILVGGQAIDRGFTVEDLTVTYMPRGIGVGNADTVQQRARFFGYKQSYLGYCRIYLEEEVCRAFENYVEHEEEIRRQLKVFQDNGRSLDGWKRIFILDPALRPCRDQVLEFDYMRGGFSNKWMTPQVVFAPNDIIETNQQIVINFIEGLEFRENDGHEARTSIQRHQVCDNIPLSEAIDKLLLNMRLTGSRDSQLNMGLLLQLSKARETNPDEICTVYRMSPTERRKRGIDENGVITNLFQGAYPVPKEQRGKIYPGDHEIREEENVTIQIHSLDLLYDRDVIRENVPVLAVWVPKRLASSWLVQENQ